MPIPWALAACFVLGLVLIWLIGRLLLTPKRFLWRLIASGVAGALVLLIINLFAPVTRFTLPVNPFSALAVGFLGLPGVLMLIALKLFL